MPTLATYLGIDARVYREQYNPLVRVWLLACLVVLVGCGSKSDAPTADPRIVGDWTGKFVQKDGKTRPGANLNFSAPAHFRLLYGNMEVHGSWALQGSELTLTNELIGGLPIDAAKQKLLGQASKSKN